MKRLGASPESKEDGLREFQRRGWVLVDATYEPVNPLTASRRNQVITRDYPLLRNDLSKLLPDRAVPVILIKANVCDLLEQRLKDCGFNVMNRGRRIFFPAFGKASDFHRQFEAVMGSTSARGRYDD